MRPCSETYAEVDYAISRFTRLSEKASLGTYGLPGIASSGMLLHAMDRSLWRSCSFSTPCTVPLSHRGCLTGNFDNGNSSCTGTRPFCRFHGASCMLITAVRRSAWLSCCYCFSQLTGPLCVCVCVCVCAGCRRVWALLFPCVCVCLFARVRVSLCVCGGGRRGTCVCVYVLQYIQISCSSGTSSNK